jgi:hypothetical protein
MQKWLRRGTLKRKAKIQVMLTLTVITRVVTARKCDKSTIKVEKASR